MPGFWTAEPTGLSGTGGPNVVDIHRPRHREILQPRTYSADSFSSPKIQSFEIPQSPLPPQGLLLPEKLFTSIRLYYAGAFDNAYFQTDDEGCLFHIKSHSRQNSVIVFYELCGTGVDLMKTESFIEGRRCFSKAPGLLSQILLEEHSSTLDCILKTLTYLNRCGYNDIAMALRKYLNGLASIAIADKYHGMHPWRELFVGLSSLEDSNFEFVAIEARRCVCDMLSRSLGHLHYITIWSYAGFLAHSKSAKDYSSIIQNLVAQAERELDKSDLRIFHIKYEYGYALYHGNREAEAVSILDEVLFNCCRNGIWRKGLHRLGILTLELLANCYYNMGDMPEAELRLREAVRENEANFGTSDSNTLDLKTTLRQWLRNWGRETEAPVFDQEIDEALGPDDIGLMDLDGVYS